MKIVEIAPLEEPVPPRKYGGIELVVSNIVEGLVKKGHEVYLLATGNSQTSATLIPIFEKSIREMVAQPLQQTHREFYKFLGISKVMQALKDLKPDIVHNHIHWRYVLFSHLLDFPFFSTIHSPLSSFQEQTTYTNFPKAAYVSISNNQRKPLPHLNWVKTIYNGIDVGKYDFGKEKRDYFAFLGRLSPEKGIYEICRMIRKTKQRLVIAGKVDDVDKLYFEEKVKPLIDGKQIEYIGEVSFVEKNELLKHAKATLFWLNWEEPFNLVVIESMACGTPVIVNPRGSMPELMVNGKNGFLVNSLDEMAERMDDVETINPSFCRAHVEKHFSTKRMVDEYEALMQQLLR